MKYFFALSIFMLTSSVCAQPTNLTQYDMDNLNKSFRDINMRMGQLHDAQNNLYKLMVTRMCELISNDIQWVNYKKEIPSNELINANDKDIRSPINICQASLVEKIAVYPGQVFKQSCLITYKGKQLLIKDYNVLTSKKSLYWRPSTSVLAQYPGLPGTTPWQQELPGIVPGNSLKPLHQKPIIGGIEGDTPIYICRGIYKNVLHVGKVDTNKCLIAAENKEVTLDTFEVMFD